MHGYVRVFIYSHIYACVCTHASVCLTCIHTCTCISMSLIIQMGVHVSIRVCVCDCKQVFVSIRVGVILSMYEWIHRYPCIHLKH